jgi:hypothetical protein
MFGIIKIFMDEKLKKFFKWRTFFYILDFIIIPIYWYSAKNNLKLENDFQIYIVTYLMGIVYFLSRILYTLHNKK